MKKDIKKVRSFSLNDDVVKFIEKIAEIEDRSSSYIVSKILRSCKDNDMSTINRYIEILNK